MQILKAQSPQPSERPSFTLQPVTSEQQLLDSVSTGEPCLILLEQNQLRPDLLKRLRAQNPLCKFILSGDRPSVFSPNALFFHEILDGLYCAGGHPSCVEAYEDDTLMDLISMEYIYDLIYGHLERVERIRPIVDYFNIDIKPQIILTVICNNYQNVCHGLTNRQIYQLKRIILNCVRASIKDRFPGVASTLVGTDKVIVALNCGERSQSEADQYANQCATHIQLSVREQTGYSVSIGISDYCSEPLQLWQAYEQSFQALHSSFWQGNGQLLRYQEFGSQPLDMTSLSLLLEQTKQRLIAALSQDRYLDCKAIIKDLLQVLADLHCSSGHIRSLLVTLLSGITQYYIQLGVEPAGILDEQINITTHIFQADTILEIESQVYIFLSSVIQKNHSSFTSGIESVIKIAKAYMNQHYADALSLSSVAAAFGYSAAYFSRSFKKYAHTSFSDYLLQVRIEHAKKFLKDSHFSIDEVALKTGFQNRSYFSSIFKRQTGQTPYQFRME